MDSTHTTMTKSQHVLPKQDYPRISPMGGLNSHSDMGGGGRTRPPTGPSPKYIKRQNKYPRLTHKETVTWTDKKSSTDF